MSDPTDPFDSAAQLGKLLQDGVTQIQAENLAQVVRTFHQAYRDAGFTRRESFELVRLTLASSSGGGS